MTTRSIDAGLSHYGDPSVRFSKPEVIEATPVGALIPTWKLHLCVDSCIRPADLFITKTIIVGLDDPHPMTSVNRRDCDAVVEARGSRHM
jgi:hypothetical protein